jgi:hypothetical protein
MRGVFQSLVISDPAFIEELITERIEKLARPLGAERLSAPVINLSVTHYLLWLFG